MNLTGIEYGDYRSQIIPFGGISIEKNIYNHTNDICKLLNISYQEFIVLQQQLTLLKHQGQYINHITFSDLDDTLLSRLPQLEEDKFANARGEEGNEVVLSMGLAKFIDTYYSPSLVVEEINKITDTILTAGRVDFQEAKIQKTGLQNIDTIIVPKHSLKPKELLYHLLFNIKKIPHSIAFFDDRIDRINEPIKAISEFLGNTILCHKVELDENNPNLVKKKISTAYYSGKEYLYN